MLNEPHDLVHELPEYREQILTLQARDEEFCRLLKTYDDLDSEIQEAELVGTPIHDNHFEDLKKRRLALKDALFERVCAAARAA